MKKIDILFKEWQSLQPLKKVIKGGLTRSSCWNLITILTILRVIRLHTGKQNFF